MYFIFPPHLTSASALPGETRNPEIAAFHLNAACFFHQTIGVLGDFIPKMESNINKTQKGTSLRESASFEPSQKPQFWGRE